MFKSYMHNRERYYAMLNDNRIVHEFGWGEEFVGHEASDDPDAFFRKYAEQMLAGSESYFSLPPSTEYTETEGDVNTLVTWDSAVTTPSKENNVAVARYFQGDDEKKTAVLVLPHWNAKEGTYFDLCKFFNKVGISSLRLTLPYHEERMPPELERADYLVYPNIGRTLQSMQQAVRDTREAIRYLKQKGYERVGLVGTSVGSCVGFLAFVHDPDIEVVVYNHVSGRFADVVWEGLSTYHVKESLENNLTLDDVRAYWKPVAPLSYLDKLSKLDSRPQRYIYTTYDLTFPLHLSEELVNSVEEAGIEHDRVVLPCGHYTLGTKPWVWIDGYKIITFMRKHLKK